MKIITGSLGLFTIFIKQSNLIGINIHIFPKYNNFISHRRWGYTKEKIYGIKLKSFGLGPLLYILWEDTKGRK